MVIIGIIVIWIVIGLGYFGSGNDRGDGFDVNSLIPSLKDQLPRNIKIPPIKRPPNMFIGASPSLNTILKNSSVMDGTCKGTPMLTGGVVSAYLNIKNRAACAVKEISTAVPATASDNIMKELSDACGGEVRWFVANGTWQCNSDSPK